jgi:hypothetical protein
MSNASFFEMVNANPTLSDRWVKVCAEVIKSGRDLFGVQLDHDDVATLTAARAATLGAHDLYDYVSELSTLEKVKARNPVKAKDTTQITTEAQQPLPDSRTAARNFAQARANGFRAPEGAPVALDSMTDMQKLQYLTTLPPGDGRKITLGRKWGLIK